VRVARRFQLGLLLLAVSLVGGLGAGSLAVRARPAGGPLPLSGPPGSGPLLPEKTRAAARALGEANLALDAGDLAAAEAALARAQGLEPLADHLALTRVRLLLAQGRESEAAELAHGALADHAGSRLRGELARLEGAALAARGDEAAARAVWQAALAREKDAERIRALQRALVESARRTGDVPLYEDDESARRRLFPGATPLAELPPGQRTPRQALLAADALLENGYGERAIAAYDEALAGGLAGEDERRARLQRGHALFRLRRYPEAYSAYDSLGPEPEARFWRTRAMARVGRVEGAIEGFETLADSAPPELASRSLSLAGTLYQDRGDEARALARYERAASFEQFPDRVREALWRIGWAAFRRGDFQHARHRLLELSERERDPLLRLRSRYWAARAAEQAGRQQQARGELAGIAREYPLSYYGWRAQQRLGRFGVEADPGVPALTAGEVGLPREATVRVALQVEAGLAADAHAEAAALAARIASLEDHLLVGRLLVASGDYFRPHQMSVDRYAEVLAQGLQPGRESLWWLAWPPAWSELVAASDVRTGSVEPSLVWAIMREESSFRPEVMSSAGARGLLQLMPDTADRVARRSGQERLAGADLFVPGTNIALGRAYLGELVQQFPERPSAAVAAYNAGPTAVARWLEGEAGRLDDDVWVEDIPYDQTQSYVKRVLRSLHVYRSLYP